MLTLVLGWGWNRRPVTERERLAKIGVETKNRELREEVKAMTQTIAGAFYEQGREQGLEKGFKDGDSQGRLAQRCSDIEEALITQLGAVPKPVAAALANAQTEEVLGLWFRSALKAKTMEEFRNLVGLSPKRS